MKISNGKVLSDSSDILSDFDNMGKEKPTTNQYLFCGGKFSQAVKGEEWIQCIMCNLWTHNKCAGYEKLLYVCDTLQIILFNVVFSGRKCDSSVSRITCIIPYYTQYIFM
jgi:hypothetical protein